LASGSTKNALDAFALGHVVRVSPDSRGERWSSPPAGLDLKNIIKSSNMALCVHGIALAEQMRKSMGADRQPTCDVAAAAWWIQ
jgi:hypothetical protein